MPDLHQMQSDAGAQFIPFGDESTVIAATFGAYELEYAAIRKGVGVLHLPQRGVLRLTGSEADRRDFLHRLLTQDIRSLRGGATVAALQLNDKGRIVADATVHHGDADTWLDLDAVDLPALHALLDARLFSEDVQVAPIDPPRVTLALLGPAVLPLLVACGADSAAAARMLQMPGTHHVLQLADCLVSCYRHDDCAPTAGVRLLVRAPDAPAVLQRIADALGGLSPDPAAAVDRDTTKVHGRAVGWLAYNTARVEAGWPLFHIDFGPDSLPHELGRRALERRVRFAKGCYLGQEIVARMQNLGHPKKVLVQLNCPDDRQPLGGSELFDGSGGGAVVGAVTSSAVSPMRGNAAVALAVVKWGHHTPGTKLRVPAEGALVEAVVVA